MTYDEKLNFLSDEDFFTLFGLLKTEPRWVNSAGKRSIQLLGLCHGGGSHSALFDPTTLKVTCFSLCGGSMMLHTFVKRVLGIENPQEAKDFIEDWIDGQKIDFENRVSRGIEAFVYEERQFEVEDVPPLPGIQERDIQELYSNFDTSEQILSRLRWHTDDHIDIKWLKAFDIAYYPKRKTIVLPHHNINGEIVGLYERSFMPLRKEVKDMFPDIPYKDLVKYPRAKYVPLLKEGRFAEEDDNKTSWSFPNIQNLYGLHLAKDAIQKTGKAIIFEGAKSVMLAHQYGYDFAVASHTFGANAKHISMLINAGAKEIIFAFDKQYQTVSEEDKQWRLYEKKTREMAEKIGKAVDVSRIVDYFEDNRTPLLDYKDAPIDKGKQIFESLYKNREPLVINKESQLDRRRLTKEQEIDRALAKLKAKRIQNENKNENNLNQDDDELIFI